MRYGPDRQRMAYWLFRDSIPVTKLVIVSNVATFLLVVAAKLDAIATYGVLDTSRLAQMPWTVVTYPLVGMCGGPLCLLFSCFWMWIAGGSLERSWGAGRFARYFFAMSAVSAAGLALGGYQVGMPVGTAGLWLPLAGTTMAFAMLNPEQEIMFFCVFPLKLKYLAVLDVAIVLVKYGQMHILIGLLALTGCAFSYWYVGGPRPVWRRGIRAPRAAPLRVRTRKSLLGGLSPFAARRARRDRERLRKLFEDSGFTDRDT